MKQLFLSFFCLLLVNLASAQEIDSVKVKKITKITTTTTTETTTTTTVTTNKADTIRRINSVTSATTAKKNIIKLGLVGFSYERVLGNNATAQLFTNYLFSTENTNNSPNYSKTPITRFSGFGVGVELKYYPKSALNGFFVAVSPRYQYCNFTVDGGAKDNNGNVTDAKANWNACNVALLVGKQWIFDDTFSLDLFIGPALVGGVLDITQGNRSAFTFTSTGAVTGVTGRAGLSFGFVF